MCSPIVQNILFWTITSPDNTEYFISCYNTPQTRQTGENGEDSQTNVVVQYNPIRTEMDHLSTTNQGTCIHTGDRAAGGPMKGSGGHNGYSDKDGGDIP